MSRSDWTAAGRRLDEITFEVSVLRRLEAALRRRGRQRATAMSSRFWQSLSR